MMSRNTTPHTPLASHY